MESITLIGAEKGEAKAQACANADGKPVRGLVRDLERVNRGERIAQSLSEPFAPFESKLVQSRPTKIIISLGEPALPNRL